MLALILSFVFGVQVYDSGSVVSLDTTSVVLTMFELRAATTKLAEYEIVKEEVTQHEQRHVADSTALYSLEEAYRFRVKANDVLQAALKSADSARQACVVAATKIDADAQKKFKLWVAVTGGAGVLLSILTFFAGMGVGH